jgi:hypothetical protein
MGRVSELFQKMELTATKTESTYLKTFYDGAPIANFKITFKDKTYETPSFDHGFPPKEIKNS